MNKEKKDRQQFTFLRPVNCFSRPYKQGGRTRELIMTSGELETYTLTKSPGELLCSYACITTKRHAIDWIKQYGFPASGFDVPVYSEDVETVIRSAENLSELIYFSEIINLAIQKGYTELLTEFLSEKSFSSRVVPTLQRYAQIYRPGWTIQSKPEKKLWALLDKKRAGIPLTNVETDIVKMMLISFRANKQFICLAFSNVHSAYSIKDNQLVAVPLLPVYIDRDKWQQDQSSLLLIHAAQTYLAQATNIMLSHIQPRLEIRYAKEQSFPVWGNHACCPWDIMALELASWVQQYSAPAKNCPICGISLTHMRPDASVCASSACRKQAQRIKSKSFNWLLPT
jgi:hypothetical protein